MTTFDAKLQFLLYIILGVVCVELTLWLVPHSLWIRNPSQLPSGRGDFIYCCWVLTWPFGVFIPLFLWVAFNTAKLVCDASPATCEIMTQAAKWVMQRIG
jgi:hypothetical protein